MTDESFMTDIDIICTEYQDAIAERDMQLAEQRNQLAEQSVSGKRQAVSRATATY